MLIRVLTGLALFVSCVSCSREENIRVAHVPQDWFNAPLTLAIGGWPGEPAAEHVNTFSMASGLASKTAVMSSNAEVGLASPVVLLRDSSSGSRIRILGCYMQSSAVIGIATRGTDVEEPIGYVAGTISEVFLANYMIRAGRGDSYFSGRMRKVPLLPPNTVQALKGESDAAASVRSVAIWEPHLSRARREAQATVLPNPSVYTVHVCLIARRDVSGAQRTAIDQFARRVAQASAYITGHPDDARTLVESTAGLPAGALQRTWGQVDFRYVAGRPELEAILQEEVQALQAARMLRDAPNPAAFF